MTIAREEGAMGQPERQVTHYFWSGWFDGQSFAQLAGMFAVFSFVDLLATLRSIATGMVKEGNSLANSALQQYGIPGFITYKVLLVTLVIGAMWVVDRVNPRLARGVLWAGIIIMAFIAVLHLANLASVVILAGP